MKSIKGNVYGYGASARSSTLLNFAKLDHNKLKFIMDKNKLKNGLFTPGTKIKIVKFNKNKLPKNSNLFILAWNFRKEIIDQFDKTSKYKFIVPLPGKPKIYENY